MSIVKTKYNIEYFLETGKLIIHKRVINHQGHFKISWSSKQHWIPSDIVVMDSEGTIHWHIDYPFGILMTYPCGTKRFVKHDL